MQSNVCPLFINEVNFSGLSHLFKCHSTCFYQFSMGTSCKLMYLIPEFPFGYKHCITLSKEVATEPEFKCFLIVGRLRSQITECPYISTFVHIMHKGEMLLHLLRSRCRFIILLQDVSPMKPTSIAEKAIRLKIVVFIFLYLLN